MISRKGPSVKGALSAALLAVAGCATAVALPPGPDLRALTRLERAPTILVPRPADRRIHPQRLGSIGGLKVALREDPARLLGKELVAALHEQGVNATLGEESAGDMTAVHRMAYRLQTDGVLAVTIQAMTVGLTHSRLDQPAATITVEANLYDRNGGLLETALVAGEARRKLSHSTAERAVGELVGEAIQSAVLRLVERPSFRNALKELQP